MLWSTLAKNTKQVLSRDKPAAHGFYLFIFGPGFTVIINAYNC